MSFIRTIFGDIEPEELGFTYSHEHIYCAPPYWEEKGTQDLIIHDKEKSTNEVRDFLAAGGKTIVDATVIDYGREVAVIAEIARQTGVQIVATTGFNKSLLWGAQVPQRNKSQIGDYATFAAWLESSTVNQLADYLIREVTEGVEGTSHKAGQLKFGTWYNVITPLDIKTIKAVAIAHRQTKAPIHTHTEAGTMALEQIEALANEDIDIGFLALAHMDRNLDLYLYEKILRQGATLEFDCLGKIKYGPESARISTILELCRKGYEGQIILSCDMARQSYFTHYGCGLGFGFIIGKWIPRFIEQAEMAGMDGKTLVDKFFIHNPKRNLQFKV